VKAIFWEDKNYAAPGRKYKPGILCRKTRFEKGAFFIKDPSDLLK
jgi:hypothetical protein